MILDTSFLIDLFDGQHDAFEKGLELSGARTVQRVPTPVVMELSYGAEFGRGEERRNVRNALRMYPVVEQDERIAALEDRLAEVEAELETGAPTE